MKVIPENQSRILALQKGEIDLIYGKDMLDADTLKGFKDSNDFQVSLSEPVSTRQLLNTTNPILSDLAVRRALQHATNRKAISDGIFYGIEQPADVLYYPGLPYCDVNLLPYEYDMARAAQELEDAGWSLGADGIREKNGMKLEINLLYNQNSVTERSIGEYLQSEYGKLGVSVSLRGEEEQSYRDNMKVGNFDMVFNIGWGKPQDPPSSLSAMRTPVYGDCAAQQGLQNKEELDRAITRMLVTVKEEEHQELFNFILKTLHDEAVYIPLTYECNKALYRADLEGVKFSAVPYEIPFYAMHYRSETKGIEKN